MKAGPILAGAALALTSVLSIPSYGQGYGGYAPPDEASPRYDRRPPDDAPRYERRDDPDERPPPRYERRADPDDDDRPRDRRRPPPPDADDDRPPRRMVCVIEETDRRCRTAPGRPGSPCRCGDGRFLGHREPAE